MSVNWSDHISSPSQLPGDPAAFFAAAVADDGVAILDQDMELGAKPDAYTVASNLTIKSDSTRRAIKLTANVNGLTFEASSVLTTTLALRSVINSTSFSVAASTDVQVGDICTCNGQISQRRGGTKPNFVGDQVRMGFGGVVTAVSGTTVTIDNPIRWAFEPDRKITLVAEDGQTRFLYHVVRIAASNIEVRLNGALQTDGVDFNFAGPSGNDPESAPSASGVYVDFVSGLTKDDQVEMRLTSNASVEFKRSGVLTITDVDIEGDDAAHGQKSIITDRTKNTSYSNISMTGTNTPFSGGYPTFGGVQFILYEGYGATIDTFTMTGGGYGLFPTGGNLTVKNGTCTDCYEPMQLWFFGHGLIVDNVSFTRCGTAIGGHGGHDVTATNLTLSNTDMKVRSDRVNVDGLTMVGRSSGTNTISLSYDDAFPGDISEMLVSEDNPAEQAANSAYDNSCSLKNATISSPQNNEEITCLTSTRFTIVNVSAPNAEMRLTGDGNHPYRVKNIDISNLSLNDISFRFALSVNAVFLTVNGGDFFASTFAGVNDGIYVANSTINTTDSSNTAPINDVSVSSAHGPRRFVSTAFTDPDATRMTTNTSSDVEALYTFENGTLNGGALPTSVGTVSSPAIVIDNEVRTIPLDREIQVEPGVLEVFAKPDAVEVIAQ